MLTARFRQFSALSDHGILHKNFENFALMIYRTQAHA